MPAWRRSASLSRRSLSKCRSLATRLGSRAWSRPSTNIYRTSTIAIPLTISRPYLEKSPEIKKLIEENKDALKQGNATELFSKLKDAVTSGNTDQISSYIKDTASKASKNGAGLEKYLSMIPGGSEIVPQLSKLSTLAKDHGEEAEKLMKDTIKEIQGVLEKKVGDAQKLADKAKKDAKN